MAKVTYYSDISGEPVELLSLDCMPNAEYRGRWPGVVGQKYDGYQMWVGRAANGELLPMTRCVFRKASPSNHKCSARCLNAKCTGRSECECECGGKNHGLGMFTQFREAA